MTKNFENLTKLLALMEEKTVNMNLVSDLVVEHAPYDHVCIRNLSTGAEWEVDDFGAFFTLLARFAAFHNVKHACAPALALLDAWAGEQVKEELSEVRKDLRDSEETLSGVRQSYEKYRCDAEVLENKAAGLLQKIKGERHG